MRVRVPSSSLMLIAAGFGAKPCESGFFRLFVVSRIGDPSIPKVPVRMPMMPRVRAHRHYSFSIGPVIQANLGTLSGSGRHEVRQLVHGPGQVVHAGGASSGR